MPKTAHRDPNTGVMVPLLGGVSAASLSDRLPKAGGTMTGYLTSPAPTAVNHAANKQYAMRWLPCGAICGFAGNYVPQGWLHCNGQLVDTTVYADLFAICGYRYGGSGASFGIPDCQNRAVAAIYSGQPDMDTPGEAGGATDVTITRSHMPNAGGSVYFHGGGSRTSLYQAGGGTGATWGNGYIAAYGNPQYAQTGASHVGQVSIIYGGGGGSHTNVQPSRTMHFMIKT